MRTATIRILEKRRTWLGCARHRCEVEFKTRPAMIDCAVDTQVYDDIDDALEAVRRYLLKNLICRPGDLP